MPDTPYRIYVCTGIHCASRLPNSLALFERAVRRATNQAIQVMSSTCLSRCDHGANALIQPNGVTYERLTPHAIYEIIDQHCDNDQPVEHYRATAHGA
ncbi:MAG: (2Fe-2S) ferredoxin domain-containing protein [Herpetosiphon sp.]|nr:(2Fe-2S) ferredoxin domain-containing protein [Herpetosiphon sp.]